MKKVTLLLLLLHFCFLLPQAQTNDNDTGYKVVNNLANQVIAFSQEKIYLQTDRPYYISGEKMFFRIFLLHASLTKPYYGSRYVYVELINPADEVVIRQQIRIEEDNMFYGALSLPEDLPEAYYRLRSYTRYMENMGEESFYHRPVFIAHPNSSRIEPETEIEFIDDRKVRLGFRFVNRGTQTANHTGSLELTLADNKFQTIKTPDADGWFRQTFNIKDPDTKRSLFVNYKDGSHSLSKFIYIPYRNAKPEITFYPEGGNLITGESNRVAFKALLPGGAPAGIEGSVYNSQRELQVTFATVHDGMGDFLLTPEPGENYYAEVICKNQTIKVDLPKVKNGALALQTVWEEDSLSVSVRKGIHPSTSKAYLLIHHQGIPSYFGEWDFTGEKKNLSKSTFKTGVSHLMLLDENLHPLSERMVFNNLNDNPQVMLQINKETYKPREHVKLDIDFLGMIRDSIPATFSISVTDDKDIKIDTTTNILAEILLVSELKGNIHNPARYLEPDTFAIRSADLLMLTHGWRNYHIREALQGDLQLAKIQPEVSQSLSGTLKTLRGRPADHGRIQMEVYGYDYKEGIEADKDGRYLFDGFELPDSMSIRLYANNKKKKPDVQIYPDEVLYPIVSPPFFFDETGFISSETDFMDYVAKSDRKYLLEHGFREIGLPEVTVKGVQRTEKRYFDNGTSGILSKPIRWLSPDDIEEMPLINIGDIFTRLGASGNRTYLLVVDGMFRGTSSDLKESTSGLDLGNYFLHLMEIAQVEYTTNPAEAQIYNRGDVSTGSAPVGLILITTWPPGYRGSEEKNTLFQRIVLPLGYQLPVEFYSPKYDSPEALNDPTPDLRSTIYWKPNGIIGKDNKASVDFYSADEKTTYSVVIEGIGSNRQLIYNREEAIIKVE